MNTAELIGALEEELQYQQNKQLKGQPQTVSQKLKPLEPEQDSLHAVSQGLRLKDYPYAYGSGSGNLVSISGKGLGIAGRGVQKTATRQSPGLYAAHKAFGLTKAITPVASGIGQALVKGAHDIKSSTQVEDFPSLDEPVKKEQMGPKARALEATGKYIERAEKPTMALGERVKGHYENLLSDRAKKLKKTSWYKAKGLGSKFISASLQAVESLPLMAVTATGGAPIRASLAKSGAVTGAAKVFQRSGLNKKWSKNMANWLADGAAYSTPEGALAGLDNAIAIGQVIDKTPHEKLIKSPKYVEYLKKAPKGSTVQEASKYAKKLLTEDAEVYALGSTFVGSVSTGMLTGGGILGSAGAHKNFIMRRVIGGTKEGIQEFFQSGPGEQLPLNLAKKMFVDPEQKPMEGVWAAAAAGAGPGMLTGGVFGSGKPEVTVEEQQAKLKGEIAKAREKGIKVLKKANLSGPELAYLMQSPEALAEYGLTIEDVNGIIKGNKQAQLELSNFEDTLVSAPSDAVRAGMINSFTGQAVQGLQKAHLRIKENDRKETEQQAEQKKKEEKKVVKKPRKEELPHITESPFYDNVQKIKKELLDLYDDKPTVADSDLVRASFEYQVEDAKKRLKIANKALQVETEAGKFIEERVDLKRRKRVSEMTPKEKDKELLRHPLTGILNKRAMEEKLDNDKLEGKSTSVVFIDADSLKIVNDIGGHAAGDALLNAIAETIATVDKDLGFHISGDEFVILADNEKQASEKAETLSKLLNDKEIVFTLDNGDEYTYSGLGVSYGIAGTVEEADRKMAEHKIQRETKGLRAQRGERPPSLHKTATKPSKVSPDPVKPAKKIVSKQIKDQAAKIAKYFDRGDKIANLSYSGFEYEEIQELKAKGLADKNGFMSKEQFTEWQKQNKSEIVPETKTEISLSKRIEKLKVSLDKGNLEEAAALYNTSAKEIKAYLLAVEFGSDGLRTTEELQLELNTLNSLIQLEKDTVSYSTQEPKSRAKRLEKLILKRSKTSLKKSKKDKEAVSKPVKKDEQLESKEDQGRAPNIDLITELTELLVKQNIELQKAIKAKKKRIHIREAIQETEDKLAQARWGVLASHAEEVATLKSEAKDVVSGVLKALGLKKLPSFIKVVQSFDDLPEEVKEQYFARDQVLASLTKPRWTSQLKTKFIKNGPAKATPQNWIKTINEWTTDKLTKKVVKKGPNKGDPIYKKATMPDPVKDEVYFSGILTWLEESDKNSLTQEDLIKYLDDFGITLEDKVQGYNYFSVPEDKKINDAIRVCNEEILANKVNFVKISQRLLGLDADLANQLAEECLENISNDLTVKKIEKIIKDHITKYHKLDLLTNIPHVVVYKQAIKDLAYTVENNNKSIVKLQELKQEKLKYRVTDILQYETSQQEERDSINDICMIDLNFTQRLTDLIISRIVRMSTDFSLKEVTDTIQYFLLDSIDLGLLSTDFSVKENKESIDKIAQHTKTFLEYHVKILNIRAQNNQDDSTPASWAKLVLDGTAMHYREHLVNLPRSTFSDLFTRAHFGANNLLHIRADIRYGQFLNQKGIESLVFVINELQCDWHQAGSKLGYKSKDFRDRSAAYKIFKEKVLSKIERRKRENKYILIKARIYEGFKQYLSEFSSRDKDSTRATMRTFLQAYYNIEKTKIDDPQSKVYKAFDEVYADLEADLNTMGVEIKKSIAQQHQIPRAPFRTNWVLLGIKRAIMQAVIEDLDVVAFPNTPQQVCEIERFGVVATDTRRGNVVYDPAGEGRWLMCNTAAHRNQFKDALLEEILYVEELKERVETIQKATHFENLSQEQNRTIDIYNERKFSISDRTAVIEQYTVKMPKIINKFLKPFGIKVEPIQLKEESSHHTLATHDNTIQGFRITPELKQAAENGIPLNKLKADKPAGLYFNGNIYLIAENIDPEQDIVTVLVHEGGHYLRRHDKFFQKRYHEILIQMGEISNGSRSPEEAEAVKKAIALALREKDHLSPDLLWEETLMYFLDDQSNQKLPWYKEIVSWVKQSLFKHFGVSAAFLNMSGYDFAQVIVKSIQKKIAQEEPRTSLDKGVSDPVIESSPEKVIADVLKNLGLKKIPANIKIVQAFNDLPEEVKERFLKGQDTLASMKGPRWTSALIDKYIKPGPKKNSPAEWIKLIDLWTIDREVTKKGKTYTQQARMPAPIRDEIKFSGLREWLEDTDNISISQTDIIKFLNEYNIKLTETVYGYNKAFEEAKELRNQYEPRMQVTDNKILDIVDDMVTICHYKLYINMTGAYRLSHKLGDLVESNPVFIEADILKELKRHYSYETGRAEPIPIIQQEKYAKELVPFVQEFQKVLAEQKQIAEAYKAESGIDWDLELKDVKEFKVDPFLISGLKLMDDQNYRELTIQIPYEESDSATGLGVFLPRHYTDNTLMSAHAGIVPCKLQQSDTTVACLVLHEFQSDWHQAGSKHGYRDINYKKESDRLSEENRRIENIIYEYTREASKTATSEFKRRVYKNISNMSLFSLRKTDFSDIKKVIRNDIKYLHIGFNEKEFNSIMQEIKAPCVELIKLKKESVAFYARVPDAPFKHSWELVMLKRMIMQAVIEDVNVVAFPATAQQVCVVEGWGQVATNKNMGTVVPMPDGRWFVVSESDFLNNIIQGIEALESTLPGTSVYTPVFIVQEITPIINRYLKGIPKQAIKFLKTYGIKLQDVNLQSVDTHAVGPIGLTRKDALIRYQRYQEYNKKHSAFYITPDTAISKPGDPRWQIVVRAETNKRYFAEELPVPSHILPKTYKQALKIIKDIQKWPESKNYYFCIEPIEEEADALKKQWRVIQTPKIPKIQVYTLQGFEINTALKQATENGLPMASRKDQEPAGIYHKGNIYLIAENIDPEQNIANLLVHEGGHFLRANDATFQKEYKQFLSQLKNIANGSRTTEEALAVQEARKQALREEEYLTEDQLDEETLMYFLENQNNQKLPWYKEIVSWIKQSLFKHFGVSASVLNMSGYDFAQIVAKSLRQKIAQEESRTSLDKGISEPVIESSPKKVVADVLKNLGLKKVPTNVKIVQAFNDLPDEVKERFLKGHDTLASMKGPRWTSTLINKYVKPGPKKNSPAEWIKLIDLWTIDREVTKKGKTYIQQARMPAPVRDEIKFSGLREWLEDTDNISVSQADIVKFLNAYNIKLTEIVYGYNKAFEEAKNLRIKYVSIMRVAEEKMSDVIDDMIEILHYNMHIEMNEAYRALYKIGDIKTINPVFIAADIVKELKFHDSYETDHAEPIPKKELEEYADHLVPFVQKFQKALAEQMQISDEYEAESGINWEMPIEEIKEFNVDQVYLSGLKLPIEDQNYRELTIQIPYDEQSLATDIFSPRHYTANTLMSVHAGIVPCKLQQSDATLACLVLYEFQSDWHQAGSKQGYKELNYKKELDRLSEETRRIEDGIHEYTREASKTTTSDFKRRVYKNISNMTFVNNTFLFSLRQTDFNDIKKVIRNNIKHIEFNGKEFNSIMQEIKAPCVELLSIKKEFVAFSARVPDAPFKHSWELVLLKRMIMQAIIEDVSVVAFPNTAQQVCEVEGWGDFATNKKMGNVVHMPDGAWYVTADKNYHNILVRGIEALRTTPVGTVGQTPVYIIQEVTPIMNRYLKELPKQASKFLKSYGIKLQEVDLHSLNNVNTESTTVYTLQGFKINAALKQATENGLPMASRKDQKPAGIYYKGNIYLVAENIDPEQNIADLLVHEGGHFLRANDATFQKEYKQFLSQLKNIANGSRTAEEALAVQDARKQALCEEEYLTEDQLDEETLMYFLENQNNQELPWYKKIVSWIKQNLFKHFGISPSALNMSGYDFAQIVAKSLRQKLKSEIIDISLDKETPLASYPKKADEEFKSQREMLRKIFKDDKQKTKASCEQDLNAVEKTVLDRATASSNPYIKKIATMLTALRSDETAFKRDKHLQNTSIIDRVFGLPEYSFRKDDTANRVLQAALSADELKFATQSRIVGSFTEIVSFIQKTNPESYNAANDYLLKVDKTGRGFYIAKTNKKGTWLVYEQSGSITMTSHGHFSTEKEAVQAMIKAEQVSLQSKLDVDACKVVQEFRLLTNRTFDIQVAVLREQKALAKAYKLKEPNIAGTDSPTISEAIAIIGDLRGTYFPRERQKKEFILRAHKGDEDDILLVFEAYIPENDDSWDLTNKITSVINANLPIGKKIKELEAKGYTVVGPTMSTNLSEDVYDTPALITSLDAILSLAENSTEIQDTEAIRNLHNVLCTKIADIFLAKGTLSSRMHRVQNYTAGFETDVIKATMSHAQRITSGTVKRILARKMILAFTGRDIPYQDYLIQYPESNYTQYRRFVNLRKINASEQENLYNDVKHYIQYSLKPDTKSDRALGYMKAITVVMYLGFRVSSAAVNLTNMVLAVPATISAHAGVSIPVAFKAVGDAVAKYVAYRSEQLVYTESDTHLDKIRRSVETKIKKAGLVISKPANLSDEDYEIFEKIAELGWDQAHFNIEATRALQGYASQWFNNFVASSMYIFGAAEKANRATTIFAAYKVFKTQKPELSQIKLLRLAKHASDRAHGIYGKATKPWAVQHFRPADLTYTFLKFQHSYMLNMIELGIKYNNLKASLHMLLAPAVLSGAQASLAVPVVAALLKLFGFGGEDPEEELYHWAEQHLPDMVNRLPRHGLLGFFNINFKGSLQMNNPFPTTLKEMPGAPGSIISDIWEAAKFITYTEYSKGVEKLVPTALGTPIKGIRLYREGLTTGSYSPIFYEQDQLKATEVEVALMMLSFNTARLSGIREKQWREGKAKLSITKDYDRIMRKMKHFQTKYSVADLKDNLKLQKKATIFMSGIQKNIDEYNMRIERSAERYNMKYLTWERINKNLRQSFRPSTIERQRNEK